jgi:hypothetical protein
MSDPTLHVGDHVVDVTADSNDQSTMLVVGRPVERCDEYTIDDDQTVADCNAGFARDDRVIECRFVQSHEVDVAGKRYAFPEARLRQTAAMQDDTKPAPEVQQ